MTSRVWASYKFRVFILIIVLWVGLAWRLSYIHTAGFTVDTKLFVRWARLMSRGGLGAVYEQSPSAYPPLGTILLLPVGLMCPHCDLEEAPTLRELLVFRLLNIGFDMLSAALLFSLGQRTRHAWGGPAAAALYFLSPTMVLVSGWWGQTDAWFIFFMLVAGVFLVRGRPVLAWICLALSILIKLQAAILLPVFVAGTWRWCGGKRTVEGGIAFGLVLVLFCVPVVTEGQLGNLIASVTQPIRQGSLMLGTHLTWGGHNVWAGLALLKGLDVWGPHRYTVVPGITFQAAGMSLLSLGTAWVVARVLIGSQPKSVFAAMAVSWLILFQFSMGVGARYLIPVTVFALVAALEFPVWWIPCVGLHLAAFFNLQNTIDLESGPSAWTVLQGGVAANILLTSVFSLAAFGLFFVYPHTLSAQDRRFQASRTERALVGAGCLLLFIVLGVWLKQSMDAQYRLEQAGAAMVDSLRKELDTADVLVINWPKEISQTFPEARLLAPLSGIVEPAAEELGPVVAVVIYLPWSETVDRIHRWDTWYYGYHVTTDMLVDRVFQARRVVAANMITDAPRVWRLAEILDRDAGIIPVARWGQQVQLVNARLECQDRILFVHLTWNVAHPLSDDITVFVHLLGPGGQLVAQLDGDTVDNLIPLGKWQSQSDRMLQETRMAALPHNAPRGMYEAVVGLYDRSTLERLPIVCENQSCENLAYRLGSVQVNPEGN